MRTACWKTAATSGKCCCRLHRCAGSPVVEVSLFFVAERANQNHDEVDKHPDAEPTEREDHQDGGADLANVEAMDAQETEEPRQDRGSEPALWACRAAGRGNHAFALWAWRAAGRVNHRFAAWVQRDFRYGGRRGHVPSFRRDSVMRTLTQHSVTLCRTV